MVDWLVARAALTVHWPGATIVSDSGKKEGLAASAVAYYANNDPERATALFCSKLFPEAQSARSERRGGRAKKVAPM